VPQDLHGHARVHAQRSQQVPHVFLVPRPGILGTPALTMQRSKLRWKFQGSIGVPRRAVTTRAV